MLQLAPPSGTPQRNLAQLTISSVPLTGAGLHGYPLRSHTIAVCILCEQRL